MLALAVAVLLAALVFYIDDVLVIASSIADSATADT